MNLQDKLKRFEFLSNKPYLDHTSEDWDEQLQLECELDDYELALGQEKFSRTSPG